MSRLPEINHNEAELVGARLRGHLIERNIIAADAPDDTLLWADVVQLTLVGARAALREREDSEP